MGAGLGVWATLWAGLLVAQAPGVELNLKSVAPLGQKPALVVKANQPVQNAYAVLNRSDGKVIKVQTGRLKPGQVKELLLDQPQGSFKYQGTLTARFPDVEEEQSMPLDFEAHVLPPPQLSLDQKDLNLEDHRLEVTLNRAASALRFTVYGDDGEVMDEGTANLNNAPAGEKLPVIWKVGSARVIRIDVVGFDTFGMFSPTLSLFPWSLEIPHQDINFPTGQSDIPKPEQPKVQDAVATIQQAIQRYGKVVKITLYVAGHTDTVGSPESNHALSDARAAAIGRAFRKAGIRVPIKTQGFGEDLPAVTTPDETDEPRNRRAAYILSVEDPSGGITGWKPL